ncbi:MAG: phosphomannomutase/phosphoglucomutase [Actinomycetota bacterium]|nr:phosphomannomutase/phosphoglucomutase [Actinomycetota bacterium]
MSNPAAVFKAYDIRGVFPDELDARLTRELGGAFAVLVLEAEPETTQVVVGRDMRPSGPVLAKAFSDGIRAQGLDVMDIGLASTDLVYFASGHLNLPAAVLTASHNPTRYNGIKLCLAGARPVGQDTGLGRMAELVEAGLPIGVGDGKSEAADLLDAFANHVRSFVDPGALRPLKVVADTANGMGGLVLPTVFDTLPFELEILYVELDGDFPNHPPDPIRPENMRDLQDRVLSLGADIGLAFDGDADRVFLVDEQGATVSGSLTTALIASAILRDDPGATIIHNLICSRSVTEVITERGGRAVRSRVGHSFIKEAMASEGAAFGGEHSGHYYFRDNFCADSGIIAALIVLEALSTHDGPLSGLVAPFDRYAASGEINFTVEDPENLIEIIAGRYGDHHQDRLDGLTVEAEDWWFNLRASNTEPMLRLNLEASDPLTCVERIAEVRGVIGQ